MELAHWQRTCFEWSMVGVYFKFLPLARLAELLPRFMLVAIGVVGCFTARAGQSVSLAWERSPDTNVVNYILYYGNCSGVYNSRLPLGTNTTANVKNLAEGSDFYFVVVASDVAGLESEPSNEVHFVVPGLVRLIPGTNSSAKPRVTFPVVAGRTYELQATIDLLSWVTIWTTTGTNNAWVEFIDPLAAILPKRFYRVRNWED